MNTAQLEIKLTLGITAKEVFLLRWIGKNSKAFYLLGMKGHNAALTI
ncbi:hypothetical protein ACQKC1_04485 [Shewanella baltica]